MLTQELGERRLAGSNHALSLSHGQGGFAAWRAGIYPQRSHYGIACSKEQAILATRNCSQTAQKLRKLCGGLSA
jgi:hypothetical protein